MSKIKEQRIVEMKFENKEFQSKAKESMNTLDDLEGKLKFEGAKKGAKNIENALNGINVEKLNEALDKINYRFSTVGITMTTMLQKAIGGVGGKIAEVFQTIDQKGKARALNLEKARFLLNGITQDAQKTADIINGPVNKAVSGTRFGLDEAALSASTLFASGITDTSENGGLEKSLKAIATAATMTNTEFSEMAQIFSTVKSNGKIMTDQVRQFNFRGLNMYQELAKVYGKTEAEMTEMVSKGKVGFNDLIEAMQHFGDVSQKANNTYEGALSNVKAALGRIGVLYYEQHLESMRRIMVALIDGPTAPLNAFKSSLENAAGILGHMSLAFANATAKMLKSSQVFNAMTNTGEAFRHIMTAIWLVSKDLKEAFKDIFPQGALGILEDLSEGFELLSLAIGSLIVNLKYTAFFKALFATLRTLSRVVKVTFAAVNPLLKSFAGLFTMLGETIRWLSNRWVNFLDALEKYGVFEGLADVINAILTRLIPAGDAFVSFGKKVRTALTHILPGWGEYNEILPKFVDILHRLAAFIRGDGAFIGDALKDMFSGVELAVEPVNEAFDNVTIRLDRLKKVTSKVCDTIHGALAAVFGTIGQEAGQKASMFDDINISLEGLKTAVGHIFDMIKRAWPYIREVMLWIMGYKISDGANRIGKGVEGIGKAFSKAGDLIQGFGEKTGLLEKKAGPMEKVFDAMKKLAVSVLILAAAMYVISKIPKEDFDRSIESIIAFIISLTAAIAIAKFIGLMDNKVVASFGLSMLLIALAMRNIARAMVIVSKIPIDDMEKAKDAFKSIVIAIGGLVLVMGIASRISGIMKEDVITRMGVAMLLMANGMLVISVALGIMALAAKYSENFDDAVNAMLKVLWSMGIIVGVIGAVGAIEGAAKTMVAASVAFMAIGMSMLSLVAAIAIFGLLPSDVLDQGVETLKTLILWMGGLIAVLEFISKLTYGKALYGAAVAMLAFAVSMNLLITPISMLGALPLPNIIKGVGAIVVTLIAMAGAIALIAGVSDSAVDTVAAAGALLMVSAAILVFAGAISVMSDLAIEDRLLEPMIAFVVALGLMTAALLLLQGEALSAAAAAGALLILSAGIVVFAAAMYIMSQCDMGKVAIGMLILAAAFAAFIAVCVVLAPVILTAVPVMLALAAALGAFSLVAVIAGVALIAIGKGLELCAKGIKAFNGADPTYAVNALKAFTSAFNVLEVIALGAIAAEVVMLAGGLGIIALTGAAAAIGLDAFNMAIDRFTAVDYESVDKTVASLSNSFLNFESSNNEVVTMASSIDLLAQALYSMLTTIPSLVQEMGNLTFELQDAAKAWSDVDFKPFIDQLGRISIDINNKIISQIHQFVQTGRYIVDGIKMGIAEKQQEVYNAGFALGESVNKGVMDALGIASPSKEMIKNGRYVGEGLMIGTEEYQQVIQKQGIKLGNALIMGVRTSTAEGGASFRKFLNGVNASISKFMKSQKLSAYSSLATQLYMKTDEYKETIHDIKEYYREYNRIYRLAQEELKKTEQGSEEDRNKAIQAYNQYIDQMNDLEEKISEGSKKLLKGPKKAFDELYKSIKKTVKSMIDIRNFNADDLFNGLEKMEASTKLGQNASTFISGLSGSIKELATVAKSTSDQFDLLNVSYDTGINLLERFGKVSSYTTRRLMVNMRSQMLGFKEFRETIAKMREMGFSDTLVDELEAQGPEALKYTRGFIKMTADQVAETNAIRDEQRQYESEQLEKNMKKQMDKYEEFYADLETLAARGLSEGIINRLKNAGIEKAAYVKALLNFDSFDDVEKWYAQSVEAVNEATTTEQAINETFNSLTDWFQYNIDKQNEWTLKLQQLKAAGVDEKIIKQFEDMGRETGMALVDAAIHEISENPNNVNKINQAYADLLKSGQKDPAKVMLENLQDSNKLASEYEKNMRQLASELPRGTNNPLYKEIEAMGMETGAEYAKAYLEADKETQKAIRQSFKDREELERQEIKRQWDAKIDQLKRYKKDMNKLADMANKGIISKTLYEEFATMGPEYEEEINKIVHMPEEEIKEFSTKYTHLIKKLPDDVATSAVDAMASVAGTATESFANVLSEKNVASITKEALKGIDTKANKSSAKSGGKSVGSSATDGLSSGLTSGTEKAMSKWTDKLSKDILNIRKDNALNGSIESLAKYVNDKFGIDLSGMLDIKEPIRTTTTAEKAADKEKSKAKLKEAQMNKSNKGVGINIGLGIPAGIGSKEVLDETKKQTENVITTAEIAAKKKGKIKSPSRLMADNVGKYLTLGIAAGMLEHTSELVYSSDKLMTDLETSLVDSINGIQNGVNSDLSINVVPSMSNIDMSKNVAQAAQIQDIFSSISGVNFEIGRDANRDVVTAINDMRSDFQSQFDGLSQTISEMQLVMDSGALVGQIANPMNEALGERIALAQRGVLA